MAAGRDDLCTHSTASAVHTALRYEDLTAVYLASLTCFVHILIRGLHV